MEQRLQENEAYLKEAQQLAHMGNWSLDLTTNKLTWSEEQYRLFGYTPSSLTPSPELFLSVVHPHDLTAVQTEIQHLMQSDTETPSVMQHRIILPDGSERILEQRGRLSFDHQGKPQRMFGTTMDVTERVRAEQELESYRHHLESLVEERTRTIRQQAQIIDQTHDSVITTDLDGHITSWNNGAERLFGISEKDALGRHISFIYPEDQREILLHEVIAPLKEHGEHEVEVSMQRANGTIFPALLSLSLLYADDGEPRGMVGYSIDLSELKRREMELDRLATRLQATNRELESFSYSVSHDLRAPLRAIDGFSLALAEDYSDQLDEQALDYLRRVRNGAQRMGMLIDDLLQLSRVNRGELVHERVDLGAIATTIFDELGTHEPERKVELILGQDLRIEGDPRLLRIMMDNLLNNAWKFTKKKPLARITLMRQEDSPQVLYISDNGVGFDMRHADKLFGAFQRLHRITEFPGTGVGLATVQRIIHRHGGEIWADARLDEGATFYFTFSPSKSTGHVTTINREENSDATEELTTGGG